MTVAPYNRAEEARMLRVRRKMERERVVYRICGVDPETGVGAQELAKVLSSFSGLVRETVTVLGCQDEVSIKVRPFREGSFIVEFATEVASGLLGFLSSSEGGALSTGLAILGFLGGGSATLPAIVRKVRGRVDRFSDNGDGSYTYGSGDDAVTVDEDTHRVVQSQKVAEQYTTAAMGPIVGSINAQSVQIYVGDPHTPPAAGYPATFTQEDGEPLATYRKVATGNSDMLDEVTSEKTSFEMHGVILHPASGSYDGAERGYTFTTGDGADATTYRKVAIADEEFRERLERAEVRLFAKDTLRVDMTAVQRVSKMGAVTWAYTIDKVHSYEPYRPCQQEGLGI